jgi:hypothetical protein
MGLSYTIDVGRRLVLTRGWGVISTGDLQEITRRILGDPRFESDFRALANLSEVTEITVDSPAMAEAAALPRFNADARRAMVATSPAVHTVASRFAGYAARNGQQVRVFRDLSLAEAWLKL